MGAGRDLGECCGSVEKRFGLGGRANGCSDHPLGASSYSIVLGRKKVSALEPHKTKQKTQDRAGSRAQGVKSTSVT